jgi:serine/threonine protein kinase/tetratricopeptide (TPR) repeat protein
MSSQPRRDEPDETRTPSPAGRLTALGDERDSRWRNGDRVPAEHFLAAYPSLAANPEDVLELAYGEYLLRVRLGESPSVEEYAGRFPALAERFRQQVDLHRAIASRSPDSTRDAMPRMAADVTGTDAESPDVPGYEILGEIARGGMGVVFRATDPSLSREVAVKLMRETYRASPSAVRRFTEEATITGQLQHPGIPPVFEVGKLADGSPFLAMKLIKGQTLEEHLRDRPEPSADRGKFLAIFEQVCQAVGYAHSKGVIHRDLKPANVMVGAFGEVQVMDWGLAKVLASGSRSRTEADPDATLGTEIRSTRDSSSETQAGSLLGTPAFMPPEQAMGAVDEIDQRSDVFGLGAILCVILTGQPPHVGTDAEDTRKQAVRGKLDNAFARLDSCRAEPDLLALCKRCLAPEKGDRPTDAGAVAAAVAGLRAASEDRARRAEVDRARAKVQAAEHRKRRRVLAWSAVAVIAVLAVGVGVSTMQMLRATNAESATAAQLGLTKRAEEATRTERDIARTAQAKSKEEEEKAKAAEAKAIEREMAAQQAKQRETKARETAEAVSVFMQEVFTQGSARGQASPTRGVNRNLTVKEAMDFAAKSIEGRFGDRPEIEAEIRSSIGGTYTEMAAYAEAETQLKQALAIREKTLGPDAPETLNSVTRVAILYGTKGDYAAAVPLFKRALAGRENLFGPDDPNTLQSVSNLASIYFQKGDYLAAEPLLKRALVGQEKILGPEHRSTLTNANNLAILYVRKRDFLAAEPLHKRALAGREKAGGPDHPETLASVQNLAALYGEKGDYAAAEPLFKRALAGKERVQGPEHPDTLLTVGSLGTIYRRMGNYAAAEPLLKRALAGQEKTLGPENPVTLNTVHELAGLYTGKRDFTAAEPLYRRALTGQEKALGPDHPATLLSVQNLAGLARYKGDYRAAEKGFKRAIETLEKKTGADDPNTLVMVNELAIVYELWGRPELAESGLRRVLAAREKSAPMSWQTADTRSRLGYALFRAGNATDAEAILAAGFRGLDQSRTTIPPPIRGRRLREAAQRLIELYDSTNRPDKAAEWRAKLATLPPEVAPPPRPK